MAGTIYQNNVGGGLGLLVVFILAALVLIAIGVAAAIRLLTDGGRVALTITIVMTVFVAILAGMMWDPGPSNVPPPPDETSQG